MFEFDVPQLTVAAEHEGMADSNGDSNNHHQRHPTAACRSTTRSRSL
jgi:hypothetical protein